MTHAQATDGMKPGVVLERRGHLCSRSEELLCNLVKNNSKEMVEVVACTSVYRRSGHAEVDLCLPFDAAALGAYVVTPHASTDCWYRSRCMWMRSNNNARVQLLLVYAIE